MRFVTALLALIAIFVTSSFRADAGDAAFTKQTHVFKKVGDLVIEADVYRPADDKVRPVVVWLHGGALIMGSRGSVPKQIHDLCRDEGYALVSFDYRLAPEVKIGDIIGDVKDAFAWLRKSAKDLKLDAARVVVTGGSAGGYLTFMTGLVVEPRPTALVAYWGYGDVDGPWYVKPSAHYRLRPLVPEEEARAAVGKKTLAFTEGAEYKSRGRYYLFLRQNGLWTKEVTGFDPADKKSLDPFCPVRNITPQYPPALMIHGTKDNDVPFELSANMAKELARHKVRHELVAIGGADHGLSGGDKKLVEEAHRKAAAFIRLYLR